MDGECFSREYLKNLQAVRIKKEVEQSLKPYLDEITQGILTRAERGETTYEFNNPYCIKFARTLHTMTVEQYLEELKKAAEVKFPDVSITVNGICGTLEFNWA